MVQGVQAPRVLACMEQIEKSEFQGTYEKEILEADAGGSAATFRSFFLMKKAAHVWTAYNNNNVCRGGTIYAGEESKTMHLRQLFASLTENRDNN